MEKERVTSKSKYFSDEPQSGRISTATLNKIAPVVVCAFHAEQYKISEERRNELNATGVPLSTPGSAPATKKTASDASNPDYSDLVSKMARKEQNGDSQPRAQKRKGSKATSDAPKSKKSPESIKTPQGAKPGMSLLERARAMKGAA